MYAGVQFRSRLEARWAAMFDLLGWPWEYEPVDLDGYIPDYSNGVDIVQGGINPGLHLDRSAEAGEYAHPATPFGFKACCGGPVNVSLDFSCLKCGHHDKGPTLLPNQEVLAMWRDAGNKVQWRAPTGKHQIDVDATSVQKAVSETIDSFFRRSKKLSMTLRVHPGGLQEFVPKAGVPLTPERLVLNAHYQEFRKCDDQQKLTWYNAHGSRCGCLK